MENNYTVYMHISPSGKRYIGITSMTIKERWRKNGEGYKTQVFYRAIEKYGWDNIEHIIIAKDLNEETAKWLEIELIREFDTTNPSYGYNVTLGGEGCSRPCSKETRHKISEANSGKFSGELNPMYGKSGELAPMFGKTHTEEVRKKISEANKGKILSEETREKISKGHSRKIICLETMEVFDNQLKVIESINGSSSGLSDAMKEYRKYKGFSFVWYDEYLKNKNIKCDNSFGNNKKKIICLETGIIYDNQNRVAEAIGCSTGGLSEAIRKHKKYKGFTFVKYQEYLEQNGVA